METGVSNFFQNLTYPTTVVNEGLQLKPKPFLQSVARLLVNTTLGIGGLFDPATQLGIPSVVTRISARHWATGTCLPAPTSCCPYWGPVQCVIRSA